MIDDADLAAIEARAEAATPGPWMTRDQPISWNTIGLETFKDRDPAELEPEHVVMTTWLHGQLRSEVVIFCVAVSPFFDRTYHVHIRPEDAAFIAHSRADVPALVAEVRRLKAMVRGEPR